LFFVVVGPIQAIPPLNPQQTYKKGETFDNVERSMPPLSGK